MAKTTNDQILPKNFSWVFNDKENDIITNNKFKNVKKLIGQTIWNRKVNRFFYAVKNPRYGLKYSKNYFNPF